MKVAILSESWADEAAVRILVEACLGQPVDVAARRRRAGGWHAALRVIPPALRELHYRRTADALVVVLDSNGTPVHDAGVTGTCEEPGRCRLCQVHRIIREVRPSLKPVPGYEHPIRIAVGLAVPAIEAWYLCGENPNVSEDAWIRGLSEDRKPYTRRDLKRLAYGAESGAACSDVQKVTAKVGRVVRDLGLLERKFPRGFGAFRRDLLDWRASGGSV